MICDQRLASPSGRYFNNYVHCPKGLLCRGLLKIDVCASLRACVRAFVTLIGSGPDLVRRNRVLPLVRTFESPKTDRFRPRFDYGSLVARKLNYAVIYASDALNFDKVSTR